MGVPREPLLWRWLTGATDMQDLGINWVHTGAQVTSNAVT